MPQGRSRRSLSLTAAAGLAAAALAALAAPAGAATPTYGFDFNSDAQGWSGQNNSCNLGPDVGVLCSASTPYSTSIGNPGGSISSQTDVTVNLLGAFRANNSWRSPSFTVSGPGNEVTGATVRLDRRFDVGGLLSLAPASKYALTLQDETAGGVTVLTSETLGAGDATFATHSVTVPAGLVVAGHSYRLGIDTTTTSTVVGVGVLGVSNTRYDNVALTADTTPTGGAGVSPGVTIASGPVSNATINTLFASTNWTAESGSGPGGSVVPLSRCTIIGTPGNDRIRGTSGNDVICGLGGNDVIDGLGGKDLIDTANGNDRAFGGGGDDMILGLRGADRLTGGSGKDRLGGGAGRDGLTGNAGKDVLNGGSGKDLLSGGSGNDSLTGGKGRDVLNGGSGRDSIAARDQTRDRVNGGGGRDSARVDRRGRRSDRVRGVERVS
ncbi:MAG: hypothetical protein M3Z33_07080 [Actinomycetota bacterium]|nr:hypothetical protein [Actinomycetota bacterium]